MSDSPSPLAGRTILVVEDEYFIAQDLRRELLQEGAVIVGPAPSLARAASLASATPHLDGAILDINLGGEMVFPVADALRARGVPFMFATGYDPSVIPPRFADVPRCEKPVSPGAVCLHLAAFLPPPPPLPPPPRSTPPADR